MLSAVLLAMPMLLITNTTATTLFHPLRIHASLAVCAKNK